MSQDPTPKAEGASTPSTGDESGAFSPQALPPAVDPQSLRTVSPQGEPVEGAAAMQALSDAESEPADTLGASTAPAAGSPGSAAFDEQALRREVEQQVRAATEAAMKAVAASAAAQKIDALSTLVLDAAELANRSATTSTAAGQKLMETRAELEAELAKARRNGKIVLGVAGGISVVCLLLTAAIVAQMGSRLARLDATVLAVGKRFVEVGTGLENLTVLNDSLAEMQAKQEAYAALQAKLSTGLEEANKASQGLVAQVPAATAKEVQARTQALMQQVQSIDTRVASQAAAVKKMTDEVKALQAQGENLGNLRREVEALVVLQRERYLEAAKAAGVAPKGPVVVPQQPQAPRGIQYPRPQPPGEGSSGGVGSGAAGAAAASVSPGPVGAR